MNNNNIVRYKESSVVWDSQTHTRICFKFEPLTLGPRFHRVKDFYYPPLRNSTKDTNLNPLYKRRHKANYLYTRDGHKASSSTQEGTTNPRHKPKKIRVHHLVTTKITNNTFHTTRS